MSVSTNGIICYGIRFEKGHAFPWDAQPWNGSEDDWWMAVNGYKPPFRVYDEMGRFPGGVRPPEDRVKAYHAHAIEWVKANPLPFELVNYCSMNHPMYILACPLAGTSCRRGYPERISAATLTVDPEKVLALIEFCARHGIVCPGSPDWYLCSYWG